MSDASYLALEKLTLAYGKTVAVADLDLTVGRGELVALLGPSGCGKTTTMRAIAGLLAPTSGSIVLDGIDITRASPNRRAIGLVFQSYALFPHLSVFDNVAFGLRLKGLRGNDLDARVKAGLESVGLGGFSDRKPGALSGGQQQRVAMVRSMVMEPKVLLLDEPLSNLDARLRLDMRAELQRVQRESGVTMIFVTHDQVEALALADRIVVMRNGRIEQIGPPDEIYNRPVSAFVARFVGFENVFETHGNRLITPHQDVTPTEAVPREAAGLAWRPRAVILGAGPFRGTVRSTAFGGNTRDYLLDTALGPIKAEVDAAVAIYTIGSELAFDLPVAAASVLKRFE